MRGVRGPAGEKFMERSDPPLNRPPSSSWVSANLSPWKNLRYDFPSGIVVFLVALPLCLGIALASGAPLVSGLITGIVAGIVVSMLGGSPLSVSGPAAGLTVIVLSAITKLGSFEAFLLAVMIAGAMQVILGIARAGIIGYYFPNTVIKGLLAAIGLILVLKQIPHALGLGSDYEGDESFAQADGRNTFTEIAYAFEHVQWGATIIAVLGLAILIAMDRWPRLRTRWLPPQLLVVALGVALNELFGIIAPALKNPVELLVQIPPLTDGISSLLTLPDFSRWTDPAIYSTAAVLAIVASIETLLSVEAVDKLDPFGRFADNNKELRAQGIGNMIAGVLGGLPMTAVIVRSSTNVQAGGRTPMSAFIHGVLLLLSVFVLSSVLNRIPLAALAAVLLHVGYKLAPVRLFVRMSKLGFNQFVPFIVTVLAILFTDLLIGVTIGLATGMFFILHANLKTPFFMNRQSSHEDHPEGRRMHVHIQLAENLSFLNKAGVNKALSEMPDGAVVQIDASRSRYIDRDVLEIIHDFAQSAPYRGITVELVDVPPLDARPSDLAARKPVVQDGEGAFVASAQHLKRVQKPLPSRG